MNKSRTLCSMTTMLSILICLIASVAATFAQEPRPLPSPIPTSPNTSAAQTTAPTTAKQEIDPRFVQTLLADLAFQTARADSAEARSTGWQEQAAKWKGLYADEKERADTLQSAGIDRKGAQSDLGLALATMTAQHNDDKSFIRDQNDYIHKLEASRFHYGLVGVGLGIGVCVAATAPNIFNR